MVGPGESWLTAAIPTDNPYCCCKLTPAIWSAQGAGLITIIAAQVTQFYIQMRDANQNPIDCQHASQIQ